MSSTYRDINYALRPAKCIERKMFCELFWRLSILNKIDSYTYVGFGSTYFSDFSLFHKSLNIKKMISIERNSKDKDRFIFNRPFKCIDLQFGDSNHVLPSISWKNNLILWLDNDGRLTKDVLLDIDSFCTKAASGSLIIVSINAEPSKNKEIDPIEMPDYRIGQLRKSIGNERITNDIKPKTLAKWGTAAAYRTIIYNEISSVLSRRNGVLKNDEKLSYKQLFNFHYADDAKMLTTGGIIFEEKDKNKIDSCGFDDLSFVRDKEEPYHIEVPNLTFKEIRYLDEHIPFVDNFDQKSIPEKDLERYKKIYRYFPTFAESFL